MLPSTPMAARRVCQSRGAVIGAPHRSLATLRGGPERSSPAPHRVSASSSSAASSSGSATASSSTRISRTTGDWKNAPPTRISQGTGSSGCWSRTACCTFSACQFCRQRMPTLLPGNLVHQLSTIDAATRVSWLRDTCRVSTGRLRSSSMARGSRRLAASYGSQPLAPQLLKGR